MSKEDKTLADRRAEAGAPLEDDEPDIAGEHTPSQTDPPNAEADGPGGEAEGYQNPTGV
jgi:hypothetical protein